MTQSTYSKPAKAAQAYLKTLGVDISLTQCYELLARSAGFRNRHEAEAQARKEAGSRELLVDGERDIRLTGTGNLWVGVDYADIHIVRDGTSIRASLYAAGRADEKPLGVGLIGIDDIERRAEVQKTKDGTYRFRNHPAEPWQEGFRTEEAATEAARQQGESARKPGIRIDFHSDDRRREIEFEGRAFFEQASDDEIEEIISEGYGNGSACDRIADFFYDRNKEVRGVFDYLSAANEASSRDSVGYTVNVNEDDLNAWIARERPGLFRRLVAEERIELNAGDPLVFAVHPPHPMASGRRSGAAGMKAGDVLRVMSTGDIVRADEFTQDGETYVTKTDGTHALVNWNDLEPIRRSGLSPKR